MAKTKNNELVRVNINLPMSIIEKVKKYGDKLGINATSAYILLLNKAIEQEELMTNLPSMLLAIEEIKKMTLNNNLTDKK